MSPVAGVEHLVQWHHCLVDDLRKLLCFEPRGHADMYGGFITALPIRTRNRRCSRPTRRDNHGARDDDRPCRASRTQCHGSAGMHPHRTRPPRVGLDNKPLNRSLHNYAQQLSPVDRAADSFVVDRAEHAVVERLLSVLYSSIQAAPAHHNVETSTASTKEAPCPPPRGAQHQQPRSNPYKSSLYGFRDCQFLIFMARAPSCVIERESETEE